MSKLSDVPVWWLSLTDTWLARDLLDLADEVARRGVSKNDRPQVERIWREQRIAKLRLTRAGEGAT